MFFLSDVFLFPIFHCPEYFEKFDFCDDENSGHIYKAIQVPLGYISLSLYIYITHCKEKNHILIGNFSSIQIVLSNRQPKQICLLIKN